MGYADLIEELGLSVSARFVPFSRSRNRAEKSPSLNWVVTVRHCGRPVLATEYSAGFGHTEAGKAPSTDLHAGLAAAVEAECEGGRGYTTGAPARPNPVDVLYSLAMDASVLEYPDFGSWAKEYGCDLSSLQAAAAYCACLKNSLKLQAALGAAGLQRLRDILKDY